jgi:cell fate regulator YaaT (PSP1 superfamily)
MKYRAIIRYGAMSHVGAFKAEFSGLRMGDRCIIRTERGVEQGAILNPVEAYEGPDEENGIVGDILRRVSADDQRKLDEIANVQEPREFDFCKKKILERELPMKLASVEHLFGGTKVIFYFLAEGRVDFRELVKDLAQEYHMRIEMRQIGVRDEARLLADYEHCGRELCCKTFIKHLEPVTMRMAKNQKATLDPTKISGRCGRLMCCLRFEEAVYQDLRNRMPRKGARVSTKDGEGEVTGQDPVSQQVTVELKDGQEAVFPVSEVKIISNPPPSKPQDEEDSTDE